MTTRKPRISVLYHYMPPDDVVSARLYGDLCQGLADRGWDVEALPSNRAYHRASRTSFPLSEQRDGVSYRRVWRPDLHQASPWGRLANAGWLIGSWSQIAARRRRKLPDVVLVGTDPILGVLVAPMIKALRPRVRVAHWIHDLYPEAAVADGILRQEGKLHRAARAMTRRSLAACDLVVDLGPCMRDRVSAYSSARQATITPWALSEDLSPPPHASRARKRLFGQASLGLLYSGNFGRAHSAEAFLRLAKLLRREDAIRFAFAVRGNQAHELAQAPSMNVTLHPFALEAQLHDHLAAADVHLVSVRPGWEGLVVPSKFFGALASGRPVLYDGPPDSAIARWIEVHQVGWRLDPADLGPTADRLRELAADPTQLAAYRTHCRAIYQRWFSRTRQLDHWERELRALVP